MLSKNFPFSFWADAAVFLSLHEFWSFPLLLSCFLVVCSLLEFLTCHCRLLLCFAFMSHCPSIDYLYFLSVRNTGYVPWAGRQSIADLTQRRTTVSSHIHAYGHIRVASWPDRHVFGLWEETGALGGNPCSHKENMQTQHRKSPGGFKPWTFLLWGDRANHSTTHEPRNYLRKSTDREPFLNKYLVL